ncbi:MAG: ATP-binding protein [Rehaibacterium terrae]|uniref:ATP-binding protein n=1 Tax=Rehaibacterium terrae TaxID=1341696 RepID=UPI00391B711C
MRLRSQLLLVALSVLVLPWAGWQFIRQMETLLRQGQAQALLASAEALARGLALQPETLPAAGPALFVQELAAPPRLDGRADDWQGAVLPTRRFGHAGRADAVELTLGRAQDSLYLLIRVRDDTPLRADAHWQIAARRDHLRLGLDGPHGRAEFRLANAASGALIATDADGGPASLRPVGAWREVEDGYEVELALPQGYRVDSLGLLVHDADEAGAVRLAGTEVETPGRLWPLLVRSEAQARALQSLAPPQMRARLLDGEGWILAEAGALISPLPRGELPIWRRWIYRWLLMAQDEPLRADDAGAIRSDAGEVRQALSGKPGATWRRDPDGQRQLLSAAVPVRVDGDVRGAVLLERENDAALLLADRAVAGLLGSTLLALLGAGGVVFWFASRLSGRIRRLRDAAENAFDPEGRLRPFPKMRSRDEIGDLGRSFDRLLGEVAAYTDYLRTLAGKLSHELNTPLAIVRTSLENLDPGQMPAQALPYLERARGGIDRLGTLVRAMSEASRIEHAIAAAEGEDFDLRALVADCAEGYRALLAPRRLELSLPARPVPLHGAPELIAQALDKLIDNARGFTPEDGWVRIALDDVPGGPVLRVANLGPPLPASMRGKLFDSLVSVREPARGDGGVHLGLGLYIVRVIVDLHRGRAEASDLPGGGGVEFALRLAGMPRRRS